MVGKKLRKIRLEEGMSIRKAAAKVNMPWGNYNRYEDGRVEPKLSTLVCILHAWGHDLQSFLDTRIPEDKELEYRRRK